MLKKMAWNFIKYAIVLISFLFIYNYVVGNVVNHAANGDLGPMQLLFIVAVIVFIIRILIRIFRRKRRGKT